MIYFVLVDFILEYLSAFKHSTVKKTHPECCLHSLEIYFLKYLTKGW